MTGFGEFVSIVTLVTHCHTVCNQLPSSRRDLVFSHLEECVHHSNVTFIVGDGVDHASMWLFQNESLRLDVLKLQSHMRLRFNVSNNLSVFFSERYLFIFILFETRCFIGIQAALNIEDMESAS